MFHGFPYTNFHDLNLDWIIKTVKMLFNKSVFSINNVEPDEEGNVTITGAELGAVGTVNNIAPVDGNVTLTASDVGAVAVGQGVTKVNGFSPNSAGEILAGTVRSINGISPASLPTPGNVVLNASDVGALPSTIDPVETVNGISPDVNGNVDVGTVKSVNYSLPDATGNINLPTVAGVTSVDGIGPDSSGNVQLGNLYVKQINTKTPDSNNGQIIISPLANTSYYIDPVNGSDSNDGAQNSPFQTINHCISVIKSTFISANAFEITINLTGGTYPEYVDVSRIKNPVTIRLNADVTIYGMRITDSYKVVVTGNHILNIIHGGTYTLGNRYLQVNGADVLFAGSTDLHIVTDTNGFDGVYIGNNGFLMLNNNVIFEVESGTTFTRCYTCANATLRAYSTTAPSTNIGRFERMSYAQLHLINGSTSYQGTSVVDGSIVQVS